tara:strand:- start:531 stop:959 length:429 start_codon:yes stop_codon:yes gene_type:complete
MGEAMKIIKEIGWQKYEDTLEEQMNSPLLDMLFETATKNMEQTEKQTEEEYAEVGYTEDEIEDTNTLINISGQIAKDIAMVSNFDCWMGHTNFNITPKLRDVLDAVDGVEVLKICSRYRFFIGVGKMFDFTNVRKSIEDSLL